MSILAVVVAAGALGGPRAGIEAATAYPCVGDPRGGTLYPEPRIFLEVQQWWTGTPLPSGQTAHLHAGTCFPLGQTISGLVEFDARIVMHNNPGHLFMFSAGYLDTGEFFVTGMDDWCPMMTCEFWHHFTLDMDVARVGGWREFRIKPRVEHSNGNVQLTSSGWPSYIANGKTPGGGRADIGPVIARGWYTNHGYQNPTFRQPETIFGPGPIPVSGIWNPSLSLQAGADGSTPTGHLVTVDPNMHAGHEGHVIQQSGAGFSGTVAIDTAMLADGVHKLFLRVDAARNGGTNAGVLVVPFVVDNAGTPPSPPEPPAGLTAQAGDSQVALSWSASVGGDTYYVYRSEVSGGPYDQLAETATTSYLDTTALNASTYYYVVSALNAGGESPMSTEVSATPALTPPGTVSGLVATPGPLEVSLGWNPVANAESYRVYRATSPGGYDLSSPLAADLTDTSHVDTGLEAGTTYYYVVTAVNALGESAPSTEASSTPTPPPPDAPTGLTATATGTTVDLAWTAVADADSYRLYRGTSPGTYDPTPIAADLTDPSYANTGLAFGTTYRYVVRAIRQGVESANSNEASATTISPAPAWLSASAGDNQVALNWGTSAGAQTYNLYRTDPDGATNLIASPSTNSYTDETAVNGVTYSYAVSAVNAAGESDRFGPVNATPVPPRPDPVTDLAADATGTDISLTWSAVDRAESYSLYRAEGSGPFGTTPLGSGLTDTQFADAGLAVGTTYRYVVYAVGAGGESGSSNEASATTVPGTPTGLTATAGDEQVSLSWNAADGAAGYAVSRSEIAGGPYTEVGTSPTASYTDIGLTNGVTYFYVITAINAAGESGRAAEVSATPIVPAPPAPTGLTASATGTQVSLSWNQVAGADGYNVYRGTSPGNHDTTPIVSGLTGTSHIDTGLTEGTTYYYVVRTVDRGVEGTASNEASASAIPLAPTGMTATAGNAQVSLSWNASTGATSYRVSRGTIAGGPYAQVANPSSTSHVDAGLANGTTYYYVVKAVNAAGESAAAAEASATPVAPPPTVLTFLAAQDAYAKQASPSTAFGASDPSTLQVRAASNNIYTYLKFQVTGLSAPPTSAKLRLCVTNPSPNAGAVRRASNFRSNGTTAWTESTLTWNNRPATIGSNLSTVGAVAAGSCYEWAVTAAISDNGTFSFVLLGGSSDHAYFGSAESSTPPQLIVTP